MHSLIVLLKLFLCIATITFIILYWYSLENNNSSESFMEEEKKCDDSLPPPAFPKNEAHLFHQKENKYGITQCKYQGMTPILTCSYESRV